VAQAPIPGQARATAPAQRTRPWWPTAGAALLVFAGAIAAGVVFRNRRVEFPAPAPARPRPAVSYADFVGAEACRECHAAIYDAWKQSTHGRAGGPPTPTRVIAPFNSRPMRFRDALVTPSVTESGAFIFTVAQDNRPLRTFRIDAVVGGGFMAGGGTQAFFSRVPDGTLRFLPFDYSKTERLWFCNTLGRANRGLVPITPAIALADCADWPPYRILGSSERFQSCQQCHGSQIHVTFDTTTRGYETRFATLAINCESCHGPGRRHVDLARSGKIAAGVDIGMRSLATLRKDQSLEVCFQCHAVKTALEPQYLPGKGLQDHFALKLPLLTDTLYFPDGRTRAFAYQEGHLSSDCYLNGSMTCVDCHDPHTQRYRDLNGAPLQGRFDNGQCVDCHGSKAEPLERHTHHRAASSGSRCVACHMPYLQEPSVGHQIRYARSDHTIPIPRPVYDTRLGVENACQQCHGDQTAQRLEAQVTAWYGELKPHPAPVAKLLAADSVSDAATAARMILSATDRPPHPMAEFAGLAAVMQRYASLGMSALDGATIDRLAQLAKSADPDVQALALATLHLTRGADPRVRRVLARQLRALGPRDAAIRDRWVWILTARGGTYLESGDYQSALAAYLKAQELKPGDPAVLRNLGVAYTRLSDYTRAIEQFRRSLAASPRQPQVLVELGFALMQHGDPDAAVEAYRQAMAVNPWEPAAYANLGVAYLRRGAAQPAIDALNRAVALDPGLADANFALASIYAQLNQVKQAAAALERGLEFAPQNTGARRMLETFRHR
jgi:tetratricopeptide (TPR) repeat protein